MGFHLRKSFKVGAFRFNLSNSGLGFSVGPKGLRLGIDGKGRSYIGGGKGILRYRKQISSPKIEDEINKNDNSYNTMLQYTGFGCFALFAVILLMFPVLFIYIAIVAGFTIKVPIISCILVICGFIYFFKFLFNFTIPKFFRFFKKGLRCLKEENLEIALEHFIKSKELEDKAKVLKFKMYGKYVLNSYIYFCLEELKKYDECLKFALDESFLEGKREKIVRCYYNLEKWEDLTIFLQEVYDEKEKEEHPIYYAMLGNAFLKQGKKEIALETMLQGPVKKRTMNAEMCAFRYTLGECYEANGDRENALKQYNKVYAYDVDFEDIQEKLRNL